MSKNLPGAINKAFEMKVLVTSFGKGGVLTNGHFFGIYFRFTVLK